MKKTIVKKETTAIEEYHAANPKVAKLHAVQIKNILKHVNGFYDEMRPALMSFVAGAENARRAGVLLKEFEETLPGKRLTIDFFQQFKDSFKDAKGQSIPYDQIQWFIRLADQRQEPFRLVSDIAPVYKQLLIGSGELEVEGRAPQSPHAPQAPTEALKSYFSTDIVKTIQSLRENVNYCPEGHLRPDLKELLLVDMKPKLSAWDDARDWLRQELGV